MPSFQFLFRLPFTTTTTTSSSTLRVDTQQQLTKWLNITLTRGFIGLPVSKRTSAKALGLYRRGQSVLVRAENPTTIGYILSIKELIKMKMELHPKDIVPSLPSRKTPIGFHKFSSYLSTTTLVDGDLAATSNKQ